MPTQSNTSQINIPYHQAPPLNVVNLVAGANQTLPSDAMFQVTLGNGEDYKEQFDMRSLFLIMKTLLKDSGYDEELIYMGYGDLRTILNRESNINQILNDDE